MDNGVLLLWRTLTLILTLTLTLTLTLKPNLTLTLLLSYPHGNEIKGHGSCGLIITISDFQGPPK